MFIGCLKVDLFIPQSDSLKTRRRVINSIKDRLKNNFNVSVAENASSKWQRASLFIVSVNGSRNYLDGVFSSIEEYLRKLRDIELIEVEREVF